jgi:hypothetical protein
VHIASSPFGDFPRHLHKVTADHDVTTYGVSLTIVGREHSKTRPNVSEARMCANYNNFEFIYLTDIIIFIYTLYISINDPARTVTISGHNRLRCVAFQGTISAGRRHLCRVNSSNWLSVFGFYPKKSYCTIWVVRYMYSYIHEPQRQRMVRWIRNY